MSYGKGCAWGPRLIQQRRNTSYSVSGFILCDLQFKWSSTMWVRHARCCLIMHSKCLAIYKHRNHEYLYARCVWHNRINWVIDGLRVGWIVHAFSFCCYCLWCCACCCDCLWVIILVVAVMSCRYCRYSHHWCCYSLGILRRTTT